MVALKPMLVVLAAIMALAPIIHTQWHKYQLKRFETKLASLGATADDPHLGRLSQRRHKEASEWKFWKLACTVTGVVLGAIVALLG